MNRDKPQQDSTGDTGMTDEEKLRKDQGDTSQEDSLTDESY